MMQVINLVVVLVVFLYKQMRYCCSETNKMKNLIPLQKKKEKKVLYELTSALQHLMQVRKSFMTTYTLLNEVWVGDM